MSSMLLRPEYFGGILFVSENAEYLELDHEAFALLNSFIIISRKNVLRRLAWFLRLSAEGREFIHQLSRQVFKLRSPIDRLPNSWRIRKVQTEDSASLSAPTLADLQLTNQCFMGCPHCYSSSNPQEEHAKLETLKPVLADLANSGVLQIAIGGGDPMLHPQICEVLEHIHSLGMVPNLTLTGQSLTEENLRTLKKTCGAVALSLEGVHEKFTARRKLGWTHFLHTIEKIFQHQIPLVFQVTLSRENIQDLEQITSFILEIKKKYGTLYGVIFLAYKPSGRGLFFDQMLSSVAFDELYPLLEKSFTTLAQETRVGYDCCLTPGIVKINSELGATHEEQLEGCSAARTSIGISSDLKVLPCTFLPEHRLGDLQTSSLLSIWKNKKSTRFRQSVLSQFQGQASCQNCEANSSCLGGCPVWNLVDCHHGHLSSNKS